MQHTASGFYHSGDKSLGFGRPGSSTVSLDIKVDSGIMVKGETINHKDVQRKGEGAQHHHCGANNKIQANESFSSTGKLQGKEGERRRGEEGGKGGK